MVWTCNACTFENAHDVATSCSMCMTPKGAVVDVSDGGPPQIRREDSRRNDGDEPLPSENVFPSYREWFQLYEQVKNSANFGDAIDFCRRNPGSMNNRKNTVRGNSLLHQAGYWGATNVLHAFKGLGADPTVRNFAGNTPADEAQSPAKKAEFETAVLEVYGPDYEHLRHRVCSCRPTRPRHHTTLTTTPTVAIAVSCVLPRSSGHSHRPAHSWRWVLTTPAATARVRRAARCG